MKHRVLITVGAIVVAGAAVGGAVVYTHFLQTELLAGRAINFFKSRNAPPGTTTTELNPDAKALDVAAVAGPPSPDATSGDWPHYNKTLTSERFSGLTEINTKNVGALKVLCTYDTHQYTAFETGLIVVNGALIGTTEHDIFSIDPATCHENWRTHEPAGPSLMAVNRGAAFMDGLLIRGTEDGRVVSYDFKTGKKVWQTTIADAKKGESVPAAPIASDGLVFIGNAGGDYKTAKGHMYALDAKTGKVVWQFFLVPKGPEDTPRGPLGPSPLDTSTWKNGPDTPISGGGAWTSYTLNEATGELYVPVGNPAPDFAIGPRDGENLYTGSILVLDAKTGAYKTHFKLVPRDWHDWDASNPPALITTRGGKRLMSVAPKDGHLYGFDLDSNALLYRVPTTRIENVDAPFTIGKPVHFCPGGAGGTEWNGPAYDPRSNLIMVGALDWCDTVTLQNDKEIEAVKDGQPWMGNAYLNPLNLMGRFSRADGHWAGWVHAVDADTGVWKWRLKSNYPITSGVTPTAGGLVFFGDMGGNFYALDSSNGQKLWGQKIGGGIGGGVITYTAGGTQKVAVAAGMVSAAWPTEQVTAKVVVLGLDNAAH
jgi:PQQ-dependent dehydrogenase (methanol/ethanol family)